MARPFSFSSSPSQSQLQSQPQPLPALDAISTCVAFIYRVLRSLVAVSKRAAVDVAPAGITFSVEDSKACQAHAFLDKSFFSSYVCAAGARGEHEGEEENSGVKLSIQLNALVECFQIFGNDLPDTQAQQNRPMKQSGYNESFATTAAASSEDNHPRSFIGGSSVCKLRYNGPGAPFILMLDEGAVTTTCEFLTADVDDNGTDGGEETIVLAADALQLTAIMKPQYLADVLRELDAPGIEPALTVRAARATSTASAALVFASRGDLGSVEWSATKDRNVIESFVMPEHVLLLEYTYNYKMIQHVREALKLATKISLRIDVDGVMSIQSMCDVGDGRKAYIDFRFLPMEEDEDEDERVLRTQTQRKTQTQTQATDLFIFDDDEDEGE
ncbi:repair protein Rad1/Rec1/Rad17-domain-containing protein [Limtongia smithiae]|uniref:repair protein Rad1/Rec1/Rad17-domain-containing protein n=1 Tax=Limtongia smithiae TaxID=1125753 RepID=UPI0034CFC61E